jgi:hypothetical protein
METTASCGPGISELGLRYVMGILPSTTVWRPGEARSGRLATRLRRDAAHEPASTKALAMELVP